MLTKETKMCLLAKYPGPLSHNSAEKGCDLLTYDSEAVIIKSVGHFSVSIHTEALEKKKEVAP